MFKASLVNCGIERLEFKKVTTINQKSNKKISIFTFALNTHGLYVLWKWKNSLCCTRQCSKTLKGKNKNMFNLAVNLHSTLLNEFLFVFIFRTECSGFYYSEKNIFSVF